MAELEQWQQDAIDSALAVRDGKAGAGTAPALEPWQAQALKESEIARLPQDIWAPQAPLQWGAGQQIWHGLTQGLDVPLSAARSAAQRYDTLPLSQRYAEEREKLEAARRAYVKANLLESGLLEIGGSTASALPAMALGGAAAEPLMARIGAMLPDLGIAGRAAGSIVKGAGAGATAGLAQSGLGEGSVPEQMAAGAMTGGVIGPLSGLLGSSFKSNITPRTAELARGLLDMGVPIRTADVPGAPLTARVAGRFLGPSGDEKRTAVTRAVARTFGQDSDVVDYRTVQNAQHDLGATYDALAPHLNIPGHDAGLHNDIASLRNQASKLETKVYEQVDKTLSDIEGHLAAGDISGEAFKTMKGPKGSLGVMLRSSDGTVRHFGQEIADSLHEAMARHSPPDAMALLADTNRKYKNLMIADRIASEADGLIDPSKLSKPVREKYGTTASIRAGDLGTLAQAADIGMLKGPQRVAKHERSTLQELKGPAIAGVGAVAGEKLLEHLPSLLAHVQGGTESAMGAGALLASAGLAHGAHLATEGGTRAALARASGLPPSLASRMLQVNPLIPAVNAYRNLQEVQP